MIITEPLGTGHATYSDESGKIQMVAFRPKPQAESSEAARVFELLSKHMPRHKNPIERALEDLSPQCSVCLEFNGAHRPHQWVGTTSGRYFNICLKCLAETLLCDGSSFPDWVWEKHPEYGYGRGAILCRWIHAHHMTKDFLRCFSGRLPAFIMLATIRHDCGYATERGVNAEIERHNKCAT